MLGTGVKGAAFEVHGAEAAGVGDGEIGGGDPDVARRAIYQVEGFVKIPLASLSLGGN